MSPSSPLLDDYNRTGIVTPGLQRALDMARQKLGPQFQLQPSTAAPASPSISLRPPGQAVPSITRPSEMPTPSLTDAAAPPAAPATPLAGQAAPRPPMITDPNPDAGAHVQELDRKIQTGSGISQIHNPWLRTPLKILGAIGDAFLPQLTMNLPGTELHHEYLVNRDQRTVNNDVSRAHTNAQTHQAETHAATEAAAAPGEEALRSAQTDAERALAESRRTTKPDKAEAKTVATDRGIMQWNPDTERYDIPVGDTPDKDQQNVHVLPDGSVVAVHHDPKTGKSSAEVLYKGDAKEVPGHVIQREIGGKLHNVLVDPRSGEDRKDLGETRQPSAGGDHGVTMIGPDGKVLRLQPGETAPGGAATPTQFGGQNVPTSQMRNVAAQAQLVHEQTPHMLSEIDRLKDRLGPLSGRWGEFMQGKIGMNDPDFAGLRADMLMYSSAVALMHARGRLPENLREEFDRTINNPRQDFANLKTIIGRIDDWTTKNQNAMGGKVAPTPAAKAGSEEWVRDASGKLVKK